MHQFVGSQGTAPASRVDAGVARPLIVGIVGPGSIVRPQGAVATHVFGVGEHEVDAVGAVVPLAPEIGDRTPEIADVAGRDDDVRYGGLADAVLHEAQAAAASGLRRAGAKDVVGITGPATEGRKELVQAARYVGAVNIEHLNPIAALAISITGDGGGLYAR